MLKYSTPNFVQILGAFALQQPPLGTSESEIMMEEAEAGLCKEGSVGQYNLGVELEKMNQQNTVDNRN